MGCWETLCILKNHYLRKKRIFNSQKTEQKTQKIAFKDEEAEYKRKVDQLEAQETGHQPRIRELEESRSLLEDQMGTKRLAIDKHDEFSTAEQEWQAKLAQLGEKEREQQGRLEHLENLLPEKEDLDTYLFCGEGLLTYR